MNAEYNDGRQEKTYFDTMEEAEAAAAEKRQGMDVKHVTVGPAFLPNGMLNNRKNRRGWERQERKMSKKGGGHS